MSLPKSIEVFGKKIKVVVEPLQHPDAGTWLHGDFDLTRRTIRINANDDTDIQRQTLFHERLHAILGISGISNLLSEEVEEAIVVAYEQALWDEMKRNGKS